MGASMQLLTIKSCIPINLNVFNHYEQGEPLFSLQVKTIPHSFLSLQAIPKKI